MKKMEGKGEWLLETVHYRKVRTCMVVSSSEMEEEKSMKSEVR